MKNKTTKRKRWTVRFEIAIKKVGKFLSNLLFPEDIKCTFCGTDIPNFEEQPFCTECEKVLPFNNGHRCEICDQPIASEAKVCDFCQAQKKNFKRAFCPFLYEGKVKNAILAYKESNQRYRAKAFAKIIVKYMGDVQLDVITYIPMTEKKEKARTFNQSKLLAEEIGKILNLPVLSIFKKERDQKSQKESTFKERRGNMIGLYTLKKVKLNKEDNILIVDDVITTGATVGYCAGLVLPKVSKVYVCAIAREYVRTKIKVKKPLNKFKNSFFPKKINK